MVFKQWNVLWQLLYMELLFHTLSCLCVWRSLYSEPLTPNPGLSPDGSPQCESPFDKGTLPSPANWTEFLNATNSKMERELSQLTLTDLEQRELYEAARLVQSAFRKYKVHVHLCKIAVLGIDRWGVDRQSSSFYPLVFS